jgi:hypothetical protein
VELPLLPDGLSDVHEYDGVGVIDEVEDVGGGAPSRTCSSHYEGNVVERSMHHIT